MARTRPGRGEPPQDGPRVRPRNSKDELDLSPEEVRALADEGLDPEELQRLTSDRPDNLEASEHDRDTARDDLEALVSDAEEGA